jgi:hypothetical protein
MPLEDLALYAVGAVLLLGAVGAGFFILSEVISLLRDIFRNIGQGESTYGGPLPAERRIKPFRDRGTVERLIAYFRRPAKK